MSLGVGNAHVGSRNNGRLNTAITCGVLDRQGCLLREQEARSGAFGPEVWARLDSVEVPASFLA